MSTEHITLSRNDCIEADPYRLQALAILDGRPRWRWASLPGLWLDDTVYLWTRARSCECYQSDCDHVSTYLCIPTNLEIPWMTSTRRPEVLP